MIAIYYVINVTEIQQLSNPFDVNGDGTVSSADITLIYTHLLGV